MLMSLDKRFIFIHVPKAAGTSVEDAFRSFEAPSTRHIFDWHCLARDLKKVIQNWNDYFRFAFVRNPWDAQVSMYCYIMGTGSTHPEWEAVNQYRDFNDYVVKHLNSAQEKGTLRTQCDFLLDEADLCLMTYVGRYERLSEDFARICRELSLGPCSLPHLNKANRTDYRDYYNNSTRDAVANIFRRDIETFGYQF